MSINQFQPTFPPISEGEEEEEFDDDEQKSEEEEVEEEKEEEHGEEEWLNDYDSYSSFTEEDDDDGDDVKELNTSPVAVQQFRGEEKPLTKQGGFLNSFKSGVLFPKPLPLVKSKNFDNRMINEYPEELITTTLPTPLKQKPSFYSEEERYYSEVPNEPLYENFPIRVEEKSSSPEKKGAFQKLKSKLLLFHKPAVATAAVTAAATAVAPAALQVRSKYINDENQEQGGFHFPPLPPTPKEKRDVGKTLCFSLLTFLVISTLICSVIIVVISYMSLRFKKKILPFDILNSLKDENNSQSDDDSYDDDADDSDDDDDDDSDDDLDENFYSGDGGVGKNDFSKKWNAAAAAAATPTTRESSGKENNKNIIISKRLTPPETIPLVVFKDAILLRNNKNNPITFYQRGFIHYKDYRYWHFFNDEFFKLNYNEETGKKRKGNKIDFTHNNYTSKYDDEDMDDDMDDDDGNFLIQKYNNNNFARIGISDIFEESREVDDSSSSSSSSNIRNYDENMEGNDIAASLNVREIKYKIKDGTSSLCEVQQIVNPRGDGDEDYDSESFVLLRNFNPEGGSIIRGETVKGFTLFYKENNQAKKYKGSYHINFATDLGKGFSFKEYPINNKRKRGVNEDDDDDDGDDDDNDDDSIDRPHRYAVFASTLSEFLNSSSSGEKIHFAISEKGGARFQYEKANKKEDPFATRNNNNNNNNNTSIIAIDPTMGMTLVSRNDYHHEGFLTPNVKLFEFRPYFERVFDIKMEVEFKPMRAKLKILRIKNLNKKEDKRDNYLSYELKRIPLVETTINNDDNNNNNK